MSNPDPYLRALYLARSHVLRETRSVAKHVPTDPAERRAYRKGLRQAAKILTEMADFHESRANGGVSRSVASSTPDGGISRRAHVVAGIA